MGFLAPTEFYLVSKEFGVFQCLLFLICLCSQNLLPCTPPLQFLLHFVTLVLFAPLYERPLFINKSIAGFLALLSFSQLGF